MNKYLALMAIFIFAVGCSKQPDQQTNPAEASLADKETQTEMDTLMFPSKLTEQAPAAFQVELDTTKGKVVLDVTRAWAPNGADRFYNLVKNGFFTNIAFFRVINGFMAQFGIHGNPKISAMWREANIADDEVKQSNARGYVSFATAGPNTRTTQLFINYGDNSFLDAQGFSPFAKVSQGMEVIDELYSNYGEGAPSGMGPSQGAIQMQGNEYLQKYFSKLDYIKSAKIL